MSLLEKLQTNVLTADGAMGTILYSYGIDYCYEELNVEKPEIIRENSPRLHLRPVQILFKRIRTAPMRLNCSLWLRKSCERIQ